MKTRQQIHEKGGYTHENVALLEVLLDMRDILGEIKASLTTTETGEKVICGSLIREEEVRCGRIPPCPIHTNSPSHNEVV